MAKTPKNVNEHGLNNVEQSFVNEYIMNGCSNATAAFLLIKPNYNPASAAVEAHRFLKRPQIQSYLELKRKEVLEKEDIDLSYVVQGLKKIIDEVAEETVERDDKGRITNKPDRFAAIKAFEVLAKMGGFMEKKPNILIQSTGEIDISFAGWNPNMIKKNQKESLALPGTQDSSDITFTDFQPGDDTDETNND